MSTKIQYLHCKSDGSYYFRRNIPLTLASYFPKATPEIRKSLKTKILKTAKVNIKVWSLRTENLFTLIRSELLTNEQLRQLIARDFGQTVKTFEDVIPIQQSEEDKGTLISEVISKFLTDKEFNIMKDKRKKNPKLEWPEKLTYIDFFNTVIEIFGNAPIKSIGSRMILDLRDTLQKLPPNRSRSVKYKGKTIKKLVKMNIDTVLSNATINMRTLLLNELFTYAKDREHIEVHRTHPLTLSSYQLKKSKISPTANPTYKILLT